MAQKVFDTPGTYQWTVPSGVYEVDAILEGAEGEAAMGSSGGLAGRTTGKFPVSPGETLYLTVGASGANAPVNGDGGSRSTEGGAGGESVDIRQGGDTLSDRIMVAGAGGGAAYDGSDEVSSPGGDGGGLEGEDGETNTDGYEGKGGTQTEGGAGGDGNGEGDDGGFGFGGDVDDSSSTYHPGGGGSGWYGGGGGAFQGGFANGAGAGGGGSGYADGSVVDDANLEGGVSSGDGEITLEYDIEPVENLEVADERPTELDLSWDAPGDDGADGQRIYRDTEAGVDPDTSTLVADVSPTTGSYTDTDLLNGTPYYYAIEAYADDDGDELTALSEEASGTTTIPLIDQFVLDASVQSELTVQPDPILNAGEYRVRWKRSEAAEYDPADELTFAYDAEPLEGTITGLLDGEQYDVGVRGETADATGEYHTAEEVTKLIPASNVAFDAEALVDGTLTWTVNSDFEGSQQIWANRADHDHDDELGELVATVDTEAESYEFEALYPDREYAMSVVAMTQYASATQTETLTTDSAGLEQSATGSRGWHVEIDLPTGQTIIPEVLDNTVQEPAVNDLPSVRVEVPRDEALLAEEFEDVPVRAWRDGDRLPIDRLEDVDIGPDNATLHGVGGTELEARIERDVIQAEAHEEVAAIIEETDLEGNVDEPVVDAVEDELLDDVEDDATFADRAQIESDTPFRVDNGIPQAQTLFLSNAAVDTDYFDSDLSASPNSDDDFPSGIRQRLVNQGDFIEIDPQPLHFDIAEENVGMALFWAGLDDPVDIRVSVIDHDTDSEVGHVDFGAGDAAFSAGWSFISSSLVSDWTGEDIVAGEYRIRVEALESSSDDGSALGVPVFYDSRFYDSGDFPSDLHEPGGEFDGPPLYPTEASLEFVDVDTIYSVRTGYLESVWNDTTGNQAVELSNDGGRTWTKAENAEDLVANFDTLGASLRLRITASAASPDGPQDDTPRFGYAPQHLESYQLRFDGDDTPLLLNELLSGDIADVLTRIADRTDSLWEVRANGDQQTLEWAQAGQRTHDSVPDLVDYRVRKESKRTLRATVKGGRQRGEETVTVDTLDEAVELGQQNLIPGSDVVRDAETGERYERGRDYDLENGAGLLTPLSVGAVDAGTTLEVEFDYSISGTFEHEDYAGDPRTDDVVTISGLSTVRSCELAAKLLVDTLSEPRFEADFTIPADAIAELPGLLEAFAIEELGERQSVYQLESGPDGATGRQGSRDDISSAVEDIESRLQSTSERV